MEDSWFIFKDPPPAVSSFLKQYLSNSNSNYNKRINNGDSTFCLLNKASIVCSIQEHTAHGSVSEGLLDSLQIIEQLDRNQGLPVPNSMRAAFLAVAVHCTLKPLSLSWARYFDAVQKIWRFRIQNLEDSGTSQLLGSDLVKWRDDVEAALWDSDLSQRFLQINTLDKALQRIRVYLREARSSMKPAFLRLASAVDPVASAQPPPPHPHCADKGKRIMGMNSQARCKLRSSHRCCKRPIIIAGSEENQPSCSKSTTEIDNLLQDALVSNTTDLHAGVTDPLPEDLEAAEIVASDMATQNLHTEAIEEDCNKDNGVHATPVNPTKDVPAPSVNPTTRPTQAKEGNQALVQQNKVLRPSLMERSSTIQAPARLHRCTDKGKRVLRNSQTRRRHKGPVIIANSEEDRPSCSKYGSISTPEVNKLRDALRSSMADLRDAVTDPLPEALEVAERVSSYMAREKLHANIADYRNKESGVPAASVNPTMQPAEENQACTQQNKVHRPSLMERNGTARTYEWEDSIDVSAEGTTSSSSRCRLPSPKTKPVSPLKEHELKKWTRKRKINRWTIKEEEALIEGQLKHGNHWKLILASNPSAFNNRTDVDLKDKWRNMGGK
ncbi:hypothetical protein REPUB_Repub13aG0279400 [Reevesia pubescens]